MTQRQDQDLSRRALLVASGTAGAAIAIREAAADFRMSPTTAQKAFAALIERGFVRRTSHKPRTRTRYAVTFIPVGMKPATNDWRGWRSPDTALAA